jgi:hypothetical protein
MKRFLLFIFCIGCIPAVAVAETSPRPGDADFYPSAEHPTGWRGDGTGYWPGATPVKSWDASSGKNIVWKVALPGPSFSQPIVVGDKVFTLADPNWLICLSAVDGKILWQKAVDHTAAMPPDLAAKAREAQKFWDEQFRQYAIWLDQERGFKTNLPQEQIDRARQAADQNRFTVNSPGQANFNMIERNGELWSRVMKDQAQYSIYAFGHWEGILTHTFATPISDGQCVYVSMSNDQIACYDLDGNCKWLIWDRPKQARADEQHVRYAMSPLLIDDKLIVAACGEMRAYDKATGKKLWGVYQSKDFGMYWTKVGPPVHMRLQFEGKPFDVLLSPASGIYRVSDGQRVGALPELSGYEGSTALTDGDIYVRKMAPDSGLATRLAGRLKVVSADQVNFEQVWRKDSPRSKGGGNACDILADGWIYSPQEGQRTEIKTGRREDLPQTRMGNCSPVLGGRVLITLNGSNFGFREKNPGHISAEVIDLGDGSKTTKSADAFIDTRYLDEQEFRLKWRWRGNGDAVSNSSPCLQGNRMFFRTVGYVWCVGDTDAAWQSPKSAPSSARVQK